MVFLVDEDDHEEIQQIESGEEGTSQPQTPSSKTYKHGLKLIQYCKTSWDSAFSMLDRLNTLRWCVCAVLSDPKVTKRTDAKHLELKDEQWKLIGDILPILNLLKIANKVFCGEKYCTISEVLYVLHKLKSKLQPSKDDDELHGVKFLKEKLVKNINTRFFDKLDLKSSVYVKAMAVDPRFKKWLIFEPHERKQVYNEIEKEVFEVQVRDATVLMETDSIQGHKVPNSSGSESDECKNSDSPLFGDNDLLNE